MDAVTVEIASATVVVLGGAWIGAPGQDLGVAYRDSGVEGVADRRVTQQMRTDVSRDARDFRYPLHHPVDVAAIHGLPGHRSQHQGSFGAFPATGFKDADDRNREWNGGRLGALADQVQTRCPRRAS